MRKSSKPQDWADRRNPHFCTLACSGASINHKNRNTALNVAENCRRILEKGATLPDKTFAGPVMAAALKLSRRTFSKNKIKLEKLALIKRIPRIFPPMYKLTKKGERTVAALSYRTTTGDINEKIGAEDIYIMIPIGDKSKACLPKGFWEKINVKLKNNVQKHSHVQLGDYNVSIRETTKHIILQLGPVDLQSFSQVIPLYNSLVIRLFQILASYNYWIDLTAARCADPEFTYSNAVTRENAEDISKPRIKERLGFPREKILPGDLPEEVWITGDNSPETGTIETNHRPLAAAWRSFPLMLQQVVAAQANQTKILDKYAAEITTHLGTYADMRSAVQDFKEALNLFKEALTGVRGPATSPQKETSDMGLSGPSTSLILSNLEKKDPWERVKVRVLDNIKDFMVYDDLGNTRKIDHMKAGSEIYLCRDQAIDMIKWGEAELCGQVSAEK